MWAFISQIFKRRDKELSFLILDSDEPGETPSYKFVPRRLFLAGGAGIILVLVLIFGILWITPLGSIMFNDIDEETHRQVIELSERFMALKDSLEIRDQQFYDLQRTVASGKDTTFTISEKGLGVSGKRDREPDQTIFWDHREIKFRSLSGREILGAEVYKNSIQFPAPMPLDGYFTKGFDVLSRHYGIDIAGNEGAMIQTIGSGVVISSQWTMNFGHTIAIQHDNNYISVYKHCADVFVSEGDIVTKGEILGIIGNSGIISSGPHVHFELWKDGMAVDPVKYLSKI